MVLIDLVDGESFASLGRVFEIDNVGSCLLYGGRGLRSLVGVSDELSFLEILECREDWERRSFSLRFALTSLPGKGWESSSPSSSLDLSLVGDSIFIDRDPVSN